MVEVEKTPVPETKTGKDDDVQKFGLVAPKVSIKFGDFVEHIKQGRSDHYLTTQQIDIDEKNSGLHLSLWGPPVHLLRRDFPLRPALVPTLVPYQMNLWIGNTAHGSFPALSPFFTRSS